MSRIEPKQIPVVMGHGQRRTTLVLVFLMFTAWSANLCSEEFRQDAKELREFVVHSKVYLQGQGEADQLISQNATCFLHDQIVDLVLDTNGNASSATIVDSAGNISLLDPLKKFVCYLTSEDLMQAVAAVTSRLEDKPAIVQFAANPEFEAEWVGEANQLSMAADPMTYRIRTESKYGREVCHRYQRFADLSARLNVTRLGGLPPNARLEINRELQARGLVPLRVELSRKDRARLVYSTHKYSLTINDLDRRRIEIASGWREKLTPTDLVTFRLGIKSK